MPEVAQNSSESATKHVQPMSKERGLASLAPWLPFETLRGEIDRVFEDFGRGWPVALSAPMFGRAAKSLSIPDVRLPVDLVETPQAYELSAELPGMTDKDIELKLISGRLEISGEKKNERQEKVGECWMSERSYGRFERSFNLPEDATADQIKADFANGVLKVRIPRKAIVKAPEKKIEIHTK